MPKYFGARLIKGHPILLYLSNSYPYTYWTVYQVSRTEKRNLSSTLFTQACSSSIGTWIMKSLNFWYSTIICFTMYTVYNFTHKNTNSGAVFLLSCGIMFNLLRYNKRKRRLLQQVWFSRGVLTVILYCKNSKDFASSVCGKTREKSPIDLRLSI